MGYRIRHREIVSLRSLIDKVATEGNISDACLLEAYILVSIYAAYLTIAEWRLLQYKKPTEFMIKEML